MDRQRYRLPLTPEQLAARETMPRDTNGWIVGLPWVVDKLLPIYEPLWREWMKQHPKHLWPDWVDTWKYLKAQRGQA